MPKKAVLINFNDIITPLYQTFEQADLMDIVDEKKKPDCLITWTDYPPDYKMIALSAMQNGVPVFTVQHGRRAMRDYWTHSAQSSSLAYFVWGSKDKEDAIEAKFHPHRVFRVGAPWFAYRPKRQEEKGLVIYDAPHWNVDTMESKRVWAKLKRIDGIRPVVKMITPSNQNQNNYIGEQCMTYRNEPGHIEATYDLIKRASAVVCMMESTLELMAHSLGVPVIHVRGFKHKQLGGTWQGVEDTQPGKGSISCDYNGLEEAIELAMTDPKVKAEEAHERLLEDAGDPDKDTPVRSITTIVSDIVDKYQASGYNQLKIFDKEAYKDET